MSAPLSLMTSCGSTELPSDFDIFRPSSATMKPWVSTWRNGARPRVPDLAAFQDWFHTMGWVREKVPIERVVDLSFLQ